MIVGVMGDDSGDDVALVDSDVSADLYHRRDNFAKRKPITYYHTCRLG